MITSTVRSLLRSCRPAVALLCLLAWSATAFSQAVSIKTATLDDISAFFKSNRRTVLTFVGYSGAGYENEASMLKQADRVLSEFDPAKTIVNIGATPDGIGAIYKLAKRKGFLTTGIVSSEAKRYNAKLSPYVDHAFYVEDSTWGGLIEGTKELSPTSKAMVENSDIVVGIGGMEVARDEILAAKLLGKQTRFIAADMNHRKARENARRKKLPEPTDFRGEAGAAFASEPRP